MSLFLKAKNESYRDGVHLCYFCNKEFKPDKRNLNRGWGMFCSKTCSSRHIIHISKLSKEEWLAVKRDLNLKKLGIF